MEPSKNTDFDLEVFTDIVKQSKVWFLFFLAATLSFAYLYIHYTLPVYESSLTLQIHKDNEAGNVLNMYSQVGNQDGITSELELMKSKLLFKKTISKLPLDVQYFAEGEILTDNKYRANAFSITDFSILDAFIIGKKIYIRHNSNDSFDFFTEDGTKITSSPIKNNDFFETSYLKGRLNIINNKNFIENIKNDQFYFVISNFDHLISSLHPLLKIKVLNQNARTIQISFKHTSRSLAKDIVTQLATEYDTYSLEKKSSSYDKIITFIQVQKDSVITKLKNSEKAIYNFKRSSEAQQTEVSSGLFITQLNDLETEITNLALIQSTLNQVEVKINEYKNAPEISKLIPVLALIDHNFDNSFQTLVKNLKEKVSEREQLLASITGENRNIENLDNQINLQIDLVLETIKVTNNKNNNLLKLLKTKTKTLNRQLYSLPEKELELARLDRILQINSKFYTMLLEKETEYHLSTAGLVTYNEVLEEAKISNIPVAPNKKSIYVLAILVAIVLAIAFSVILYLLHDEITSLTDITRRISSNVSVLGIIPHYKSKIPVSQLIIHKNPKSLITEAFRSIRTNLEFITNSSEGKVIAVTSTISGEGKTFIALNLGGIIAFSGKKVIVLDLDMRKPKIHIGFGVNNNEGMSTLLIKKSKLEDCINPSELEGLDFITAGPIPPNPAELIINGEIDKLVTELKKTYDTIIIDNPPVGLVTDGLSIIKKADFPIYVFKANYSKKHFTDNAERIIKDNKVSKLSIVLNNIDTQKSTYGKGYGYGYTTYGGYYTEEQEDKKKRFSFKKK